MKFRSAKQVWAEVYEGFYLSVGWGDMGAGTDQVARTYHCPFCRQSGFMRALPAGQGVLVLGVRMRWRCGACYEYAQRPLLLKRRGSITASQTRMARAGAGDYAVVDGLQAARVMSAIEQLPEHCYTWGMWVYTGLSLADLDKYELDVFGQRRLAMLGWLARELDGAGLPDVADDEEAELEQTLLFAVLDDARQRERCGRRLHSKTDIASALGVDRRCFDARYKWGKRYAAAVVALERLTAETLGPVSAVVEGLRRGGLAA